MREEGDMVKSGWANTTIQAFVDNGEIEVQTGPFGTQLRASDYVEHGIPVINVKNVGYGGLKEPPTEFLSEHKALSFTRHRIEENDIVFGRKGAVDRHLFAGPTHWGWIQGSDCIRLRVRSPSLEPRFLSYLFRLPKHRQWMLSQSGNKATMASLNQDIIGRIPISVPSADEQLRIADLLSAYDDLIENNRRRIAILEALARNLYQEWFVRLRFPGHESTKIVDGVPEGWEVGCVTDFVDVMSGGTPKTSVSDYWSGRIPFFTPKDAGEGFYVFDTEKHVSEAGVRNCNSRLFPKDTVFITARGTVGKIRLAQRPMAMNQSCYALVLKSGKWSKFLYLRILETVRHVQSQATGAVFDAIVVETFRKIPFVMADEATLARFDLVIAPIFEQMDLLSRHVGLLSRTRDLLLPRLMSGEIEV